MISRGVMGRGEIGRLKNITNSEVNSVSDLAELVATLLVADRPLFRGQNTDQPLLPKIARQKGFTGDQLVAKERDMLDRLKKESTPFLVGKPESDWDWLSIAQHQGMTTRLLDWSSSALTALWFAVASDPPATEAHGVLWMLDVDSDAIKSPSGSDDVLRLSRTYLFQPFHIDRRISAQSGWFSVHKYINRTDKNFVPLDKNLAFKGKAKKFIIPRSAYRDIRRQLRVMGVTRASLFPDLSGLCADIDVEFLHDYKLDANDI